MKALQKLFEKDCRAKLLLLILLYCLLPLSEITLMLFMGGVMGRYR